jgi:hypothetical protein
MRTRISARRFVWLCMYDTLNVLRLTAGGNGCFFWKQPIVNRFQGCSRSFFWEQPTQQVQNTLFPGCIHMEQ